VNARTGGGHGDVVPCDAGLGAGQSVVHFLLLDFGWFVTILWMVGDHPGDGDMVLILWIKYRCQIPSL